MMLIPFILFLSVNGSAISNSPNCPQYKMPLSEVKKLAEDGSDYHLNMLGELYHFGCGVKQNFKKAYAYYLQAVEKKNATAANHLGRIYLNGEGVKKDREEAEKWYKKSVELDPSDENRCMNGQFPDRSFCTLLKLSYQGNGEAMVAVGENYLNGITHRQETVIYSNAAQAKKWFMRASEQEGNLKAHWLLYKLCKEGIIPCEGTQEIEKWRIKGLKSGGSPLDFQ